MLNSLFTDSTKEKSVFVGGYCCSIVGLWQNSLTQKDIVITITGPVILVWNQLLRRSWLVAWLRIRDLKHPPKESDRVPMASQIFYIVWSPRVRSMYETIVQTVPVSYTLALGAFSLHCVLKPTFDSTGAVSSFVRWCKRVAVVTHWIVR